MNAYSFVSSDVRRSGHLSSFEMADYRKEMMEKFERMVGGVLLRFIIFAAFWETSLPSGWHDQPDISCAKLLGYMK